MIQLSKAFDDRYVQARDLVFALQVMSKGLSMPEERNGLHGLACALQYELMAMWDELTIEPGESMVPMSTTAA